MSAFKGTPGPWVVEMTAGPKVPNRIAIIRSASDRFCEVAACRIDVRHRPTDTVGRREINAALISQAPAMLEALTMLNVGPHLRDADGPCLCNQCAFFWARDRILAALREGGAL